jgi:hypothetical protein
LYQVFVTWSQAVGESTMTETAFCKRLGEKGFAKRRDEHGVKYLRIGLKSGHDDTEE